MASVPSNIPSSLTAGYSEFIDDNAAAANQYNDSADQLWADYLAFEKDYFDKYQASLDQYGTDLSGVDKVSVTMPDTMGGATVELAPKVHSAMYTDQLNARNNTIANQANTTLAGLGSRDALAKNRYGVDQTALANSLIPTTVGTDLYKMERGGQLGIAQQQAGVYQPSTMSTWAPVVGTVLGSDVGQTALNSAWDFVTGLFKGEHCMNNGTEEQTPSGLPSPADYKKSQTNILAELIPQIMNAMGGGDPYTTKVLQQQAMENRQRNEKMANANNIRGFMRSVAMPATGQITPELILQQAEMWGIDPETAMQVVGSFQQFRQNKQPDLFKSYADDGSFTWLPKVAGASGSEMPGSEAMPYGSSKMGIYDKRTGQVVHASQDRPGLQKVPDGKGGWRFVRPMEGLAGMNNPPNGMRIETGPDGTVVQTNVPAGSSSVLTPKAKSSLQDTMIETQQTHDNLIAGMANYDDSYLKGKDKLGYAIDAFKEKWELGEVSAGEKQELEKYTEFKRNYISTLNKYIQQITGAAMSAEEAKRLLKGMPNPGTGLFDGDSPTEFKAKLNGVLKELGRIRARAYYTLQNNIQDPTTVPLNAMDRIIEARGSDLEKRIRAENPQAQDGDIETLVRNALAKEFGMKNG